MPITKNVQPTAHAAILNILTHSGELLSNKIGGTMANKKPTIAPICLFFVFFMIFIFFGCDLKRQFFRVFFLFTVAIAVCAKPQVADVCSHFDFVDTQVG